jgi:hypothetical protein
MRLKCSQIQIKRLKMSECIGEHYFIHLYMYMYMCMTLTAIFVHMNNQV